MKKYWLIFSAIVGLMLVIVLSTPLFMGLLIQKRYPQLIKDFNTPHVSFELVNFKSGWFSSIANIKITLRSAETGLTNDSSPLASFVIAQKIQHGPILIQKTKNGSRHFITALAIMQNKSLADNINFKTDTVWTLNNRINTLVDVQKILLGNDRQRIEINQLVGTISFIPSEHRFISQLTLANGSLFENNPEKVGNDIVDLVKVMELTDFGLTMNITKVQSVWYGERHFTAGKITVFPYGGADVLSADNFAVNLNQTQHDELTDFELTNQIEQISEGQFKIGQLQLAFSLKNMNTGLLQNFAENLLNNSDFQRLKLYSNLIDMFAKGMSLDLSKLQFNTESGPVMASAQINSPVTNITISGLLHLIENLNIQAHAEVPKEWLMKNLTHFYETKQSENPQLKINPDSLARQYMEHWLTHHLIIPKDQQVSMNLKYKEGRLLINGEKPSLDNFLVNNPIGHAQ